MRVLFMVNAYPDPVRPYWGAFVRSEVVALQEAGLEVDVLAVRGYAGKAHYATGALRSLALNARRPYDVVHAHYGLMGYLGRLQLRCPLVVSFTGGDIQGDPDPAGGFPHRARLRAKAYASVAWLAAATITKSKALVERIPPARRHRNHVIPTGVDLSRFGAISREAARERLGWPQSEPTVIFIAHSDRPVKNLPLASAAVEKLQERLPAAKLRVASSVLPDEIPVWMAAADALLLTSRSEGSPNVIKEAMAAELPAVSTPVGDVPERFRGVPGCFVRPPEADALAEALEQAVTHGRTPEARAAIAELDSRLSARRIIGVYESVTGQRNGAGGS